MKLLVSIGGTSFELHTKEIGEAIDFAHTFVHNVSAAEPPLNIKLIDMIDGISPTQTAFSNHHQQSLNSPAAAPNGEATQGIAGRATFVATDPTGPSSTSPSARPYDNYETFYVWWLHNRVSFPNQEDAFEAGKSLNLAALDQANKTIQQQADALRDRDRMIDSISGQCNSLNDKCNDYALGVSKLTDQVNQDMQAMAQAQQAITELQRDLEQKDAKIQQLVTELDGAYAERERVIAQRSELGQVIQALNQERETLKCANQNISAARDDDTNRFHKTIEKIQREREQLIADMEQERSQWRKSQKKLNQKYQQAIADRNEQSTKRSEAAATIDTLSTQAAVLTMQAEANEQKYQKLHKNLVALNQRYHALGRQQSTVCQVLAIGDNGRYDQLNILKVWPTEAGIQVTVEKTWK